MSFRRNSPVHPVLSNYLVPRGQRYWGEPPEAPAEAHWEKKTERTTNISEFPPLDSSAHSPSQFSLFHSVDEYDTGRLQSPGRGDFPPGGFERRRAAKFKLEDSRFEEPSRDLSDFDSRFESFEAPRAPERFREYERVGPKEGGRRASRDFRESRGGDRFRHSSSGRAKLGNSGPV